MGKGIAGNAPLGEAFAGYPSEQEAPKLDIKPPKVASSWKQQVYNAIESKEQPSGEVPDDIDVYALTLILVESMSAYASLRTTFDRAPDDIDDDRYVEAWVALAADTLERAARQRDGQACGAREGRR
jgi:hypothetical protein